MNKNSFVKFSLTLISTAVLAACSSGGSGNNNAAKASEHATQQAETKAAAEKAAAEKEAETKASISVGHKLVKKTDSNFVLGLTDNDTVNSSTGRSDNMDLELYPSLDTVVVSVPLKRDGDKFVTDDKAPIGYLEDFDFRGNTENTTGTHTLQHIYKTNGTTTGAAQARESSATKTATAGNESGEALVYQDGRAVYIGKDESVSVNNSPVAVENLRDRTDTVAEVYGHRTFVEGDSLTGKDASGNITGSEKTFANAPFAKKDANGNYTLGDNYSKVQYGRVTSKLDHVKREDTKEGVNAGAYGTKVVSYGEYGEKGTENSYFYRGVNDTAYNANLAGKLASHYATYDDKGEKVNAGKLSYQGHAVTYGFNHANSVGEVKQDITNVPNALGAKPVVQPELPTLVSGTHVHADIDLSTKAVTGQLYDVWSNGAKDIASFNGQLDNSGAISGTSQRTAGGEGTFNANLFGENADELGGALASKATDAQNSWGAVFGAKVQNVPGVAPAPVAPKEPDSAWGVKTDENK